MQAPSHQAQSGPRRSHEHQRRGRAAGRVLVLNATYEPINVCTVRRAAVLLLKEKAEVIEHATWDAALRAHAAAAADGHPPRDATCRSRATRTGARSPGARCSPATAGRASTAARARTSPSTTSSRAPRAARRAGTTSSPSCAPCNRRKGDLLPAQANMTRAAPARAAARRSSSTSPVPTIPAALAAVPARRPEPPAASAAALADATKGARRRGRPSRQPRWTGPRQVRDADCAPEGPSPATARRRWPGLDSARRIQPPT